MDYCLEVVDEGGQGVAPMVTDLPHVDSTTRQNPPIFTVYFKLPFFLDQCVWAERHTCEVLIYEGEDILQTRLSCPVLTAY